MCCAGVEAQSCVVLTTPWLLPLTWPHSSGLICALHYFFTAKVTSVKLCKAATYVLRKSLDLAQFDITSVTCWHWHHIVTCPHQLVSCGLLWLVVVTRWVNITYLSLTSLYVAGKSLPTSLRSGPVVSSCRSLSWRTLPQLNQTYYPKPIKKLSHFTTYWVTFPLQLVSSLLVACGWIDSR